MKTRLIALLLLIATLGIGWFVWKTQANPASAYRFRLGLDLQGGTALTYQADVSKIDPSRVAASMASLRDVIERRVNLFGVSEPVVQTEEAGIAAGSGAAAERLIVELPGVTDVQQAVDQIGKTPLLEFRTLTIDTTHATIKNGVLDLGTTSPQFVASGLTGRYLDLATLEFDPTTGSPIIGLSFNAEGKDLFDKLTKDNVGKPLAIYLDGEQISAPTVNEEIRDGKAQITGSFTVADAQKLVRDLNYGSLPVPITLISTQTVGATLGEQVLNSGVKAGIIGLIIIGLFLILWYRLPGLVSVVSLATYIALMLALFKLIPVTLTSAGIAGFILSMGMAVDANILIFERMKEEIRSGRSITDSIREGFARAWLSIRDGNLSGLIASVILFWLGTSLVKGFALTLGLGIIVSLVTALVVSRTYLLALPTGGEGSSVARFFFGSGFRNKVDAHDFASQKRS